MTKDQAVLRAGSVTNLAAIMGITPGAIRTWHGELPAHRERQLRTLRPEWFTAPRSKDRAKTDGLAQIVALADEIKRQARRYQHLHDVARGATEDHAA